MPKPDPAAIRRALRAGERVAVEWRHEELRRSFRTVGTVVEVIDAEDGVFRVVIEVAPRFGRPARQTIEGDAIVGVEPAQD